MNDHLPTSENDFSLDLQDSLKNAMKEKFEAAKYGLHLLEEKQHLQAKLQKSEETLIQLKQEFKILLEQCNRKGQFNRRLSQIELQEDDLLIQSANREFNLKNSILDLETELKYVKYNYEHQMTENDKLQQIFHELQDRHDELENNRHNLKDIIKYMEVKQSQLLSEIDDLESDNFDLQKNVLTLKTKQIEFESLKHELKCKIEQNELLNQQLDEITKLKRLTEKSLEETLETLQIERDKRKNFKIDFENQFLSDNLLNLNLSNYSFDNKFLFDQINPSDQKDCPDDLFTELQSSEVSNIPAKDIKLVMNKIDLHQRIKDTQRTPHTTRNEVENKEERICELQAELDAVIDVKARVDVEFEVRDNLNNSNHMNDLKSFNECKQLTVETTEGNILQEADSLQAEIVRLKNSLATKRDQIGGLRCLLKTNMMTAESALASLKCSYNQERTSLLMTVRSLQTGMKKLIDETAINKSTQTCLAQQYINRVDELTLKLMRSEDEKNSLNSMLRLAIKQKLFLTQHLKEYEEAKECSKQMSMLAEH